MPAVVVERRFDDGVTTTDVLELDVEGLEQVPEFHLAVSVPAERGAADADDVRSAVRVQIDNLLAGTLPSGDVDASIDELVARTIGQSSVRATPAQVDKFERFSARPGATAAVDVVRRFLATAGSTLGRQT